MTMREKVVLSIDNTLSGDDRFDTPILVAAVINRFLEVAAEDGWHMRPDEATEKQWKNAGFSGESDWLKGFYRAMLAAAPEFEWDK